MNPQDERITRAMAALDAYSNGKSGRAFGDQDTAQELFADLLTDLRHLAELNEIDFDLAFDDSRRHFEAERGEGDDLEQDYRATSA